VLTNCGTSTNVPNIAKPAISAVVFVRSTGRWLIIRMSTIGSATRNSVRIQVASSTALAAISPRNGRDVQPQLSPSVSATSRETSAPASNTAPGMSTRVRDLIGDSGT
jgi:hypothetical protein